MARPATATEEAPRAEPQLLLTSLLGDHWYWRDEHIPSAALVRLLAEFGIGPDNARAAMRRLVARGLLTTSRSGRTTAYGIPPRTAEVIIERIHRMLTFGTAPAWDGHWTLVAFSVPEHDREVRTALRSRLRVLGFAMLYDGMWVSPHDLGAAATALLGELGVERGTVLRAARVPGGPLGGDPVRAFDLDGLARRYSAFATRWRAVRDRLAAGPVEPGEALRIRTELRVEWRDFPELDPGMPVELLPADWPRALAQQVFTDLYDHLGPPAEQRFRAVLALSDPALAELASHHDSRSIDELFAGLGERRAHGDTPFEQAISARRLADERARRRHGRRPGAEPGRPAPSEPSGRTGRDPG